MGSARRSPRPLRRVPLCFALLLLGAACSGGRGDPRPATRIARPEEKLSPSARRVLAGDGPGRYVVEPAGGPDLVRLSERLGRVRAGRLVRRRIALEALRQASRDGRRRLRPVLEELRAHREVLSYRGFAALDRIVVEATDEAVRTLVASPAVRSVEGVIVGERGGWQAGRSAAPRPPAASWGIAAIGAARAWADGWDGQGVVVGIVDSGATAVHEQLHGGFRGGPRSWLDPLHGRALPWDGAQGHGTGVLSCAVGRNPRGIAVGVAPGARWIACAAFPDGRFDTERLLRCADWVLTTAQPDILINAWRIPGSDCDRSLRDVVDAWRAAEILPVFAAGNDGPGTNRPPANYGGLYPGGAAALSVAGLARSGGTWASSSTGPNRCGAAPFPLLAAPAEGLTVAFPLAERTYREAAGTSFGAGLAAGAAAILLQSDPQASVVEVEAALVAGAADLGAPGLDPVFGHGRLDVPGALEALRALR